MSFNKMRFQNGRGSSFVKATEEKGRVEVEKYSMVYDHLVFI